MTLAPYKCPHFDALMFDINDTFTWNDIASHVHAYNERIRAFSDACRITHHVAQPSLTASFQSIPLQ